VYAGILCLRHLGYLTKAEDLGTDFYMYLFSRSIASAGTVRPFAFIDIDDETFSRWGEPFRTPREKLFCLVNFARASRARLIIVDVDLTSYPDLPESNLEFAGSLRRFSASTACGGALLSEQERLAASNIPIIFIRSLSLNYRLSRSRLDRIRPTDLDDIVGTGNLYWGLPPLLEKDPDGVVRRWIPWAAACNEEVDPPVVDVLLSVPVVARALIVGTEPRDIRDEIEPNCRPATCADDPNWDQCPKALSIGDTTIDLSHRTARLIYALPLPPLPEGDRPQSSGARSVDRTMNIGGHSVPVVARVPALSYTRLFCRSDSGQDQKVFSAHSERDCLAAPLGMSVRPDLSSAASSPIELRGTTLTDRIVVIGGSYHASGDIHGTPIQQVMPGAMILINAINTALQHGTPGDPARFTASLMFFVQVLIVAGAFTLIRGALAPVIAFGLSLVFTFAVSTIALQSSVWIDSSLASMTVFAHRHLHELARRFVSRLKTLPRVLRAIRMAVKVVMLLILSATSGSVALGADHAGRVVWLSDAPHAYAIHREGTIQNMKVLGDLYSDDRIVFVKDHSTLDIGWDDGGRTTIASHQSPFTIEARARPGLFSELADKLANWLTPYWSDGPPTPIIGSVRQLPSEPLKVGLFTLPWLRIVAGEGRLRLAWHGGQPPFLVRVSPKDRTEPIFEVPDLTERTLDADVSKLRIGRYRIEVRDASMPPQVKDKDFDVVARSALPEFPSDPGLGAMPADLRTTVLAAWLAAQDNGAWALESYRRLSEINGERHPARIIRGLLAEGRIPHF
jgi:hypothetical protein